MWEEIFGKIPKGLSILHKCDNPSCINPAHLFLGTQADNIKDMRSKGRNPKGEDYNHAKLNNNDVRNIRLLLLEGMPQTKIALLHNVSRTAIYHIKTGQTWSHI